MFKDCYFANGIFPFKLKQANNPIKVRALKDFIVGPSGHQTLAIGKGEEYSVLATPNNKFVVFGKGFAFGICTLGEGWTLIDSK